MSTEETLLLLLSVLQIIIVTTSDANTSEYCVRILEEVEDKDSLEMLLKFYNKDLN